MARKSALRNADETVAKLNAALAARRVERPYGLPSGMPTMGGNAGWTTALSVKVTKQNPHPWAKHEAAFYGGQNTKWNAHADKSLVQGTLRDMGKGADFW